MSVWCHVVGVIRIDGFTRSGEVPSLGKGFDADSPTADWDKCTLPSGSEGSLKWTFQPYAKAGLPFGQYSIWGDLRDFGLEDLPEWDAWLEAVRVKFAPALAAPDRLFFIRQASILVEIEGQNDQIVYTWRADRWVKTVVGPPQSIG